MGGVAALRRGSVDIKSVFCAGKKESNYRQAAATAHALGALDELFQEEEWGADAEAVKRRALVGADIDLAARFMALAQAQGAA